jgi:4a-hydroxytetrahydrobiopterin dehydratase
MWEKDAAQVGVLRPLVIAAGDLDVLVPHAATVLPDQTAADRPFGGRVKTTSATGELLVDLHARVEVAAWIDTASSTLTLREAAYEEPLTGDTEMETLTEMKCVACRKDAPTVTDAEIAEFQPQVSDWEIVELDGIKRLRQAFSFDDFEQALEFTNKVGELAEEEGHHPALTTEWGSTTVTWWTHKIRGLHRNDFVMAAKTDVLYQP